ncbi:MAG TPA: hypothetical protein VKF84_07790 [Candidatus Sulfotelmatobacter sp.]|nr:hypothetical protein [Candidatus Sulfotelmatobacter sp.]
MTKNTNLKVRIRHAFTKVRNGLQMNGLRYHWFKARTTDGVDLFWIPWPRISPNTHLPN